jgi:microcin C transport system permease protein
MIFPPIPYGPLETLDPASIPLKESVTLEFTPNPRIATLTLARDYRITRSIGLQPFLTDTRKGQSLTNDWIIPMQVSEALEQRWANSSAPALDVKLTSRHPPTTTVALSLPEFSPRATPPTTMRLMLRDEDGSGGATHGAVALDSSFRVVSSSFSQWDQLSALDRSNLTVLAGARLAGPCEDQSVTLNGTSFTVRATPAEVRWPFKPVSGHWMGVDCAGRDVFARLFYGLRTSMTFGFLLVAVTMVLGTTLGAIQGYFGNTVDIVGQRITEIWSAIPFLYVMILLGSVYGRGFIMLLCCYAIFNWIGISYYIRGEFLRLRHLPFVEAARILGLPHRTIIFRHILPNAIIPLITFFPFSLVGAIGSLAALDYLGFGLPPPTASWGELLAQAQQFRWAWWLILYPAGALFAVMLLGVFVGEGIRNAYDPRPKTRFE